MKDIKYLSCIFLILNSSQLLPQNWFPLQIGNEWQYISIDYIGGNGNDTSDYNANLFVNSVVKDTLISSKNYYQLTLYPQEWFTYNEMDKVILVRWNDADSLVMNFSSPVESYIYCFLPDMRDFWYSEIDSGEISVFDTIKTFKGNSYFVVGPDVGGEFKYVESYGLVEYNYHQSFPLPPSPYREQYLIIQANIDGANYSESVYPVIKVSPLTTISDSTFSLIFEVEHQYSIFITSSFPHTNLNFVDSVHMYSFYSREDSVVNNAPVICENIPNTEQWTFNITLNMNLLMNDFQLNYIYEAVDKGLVPHRSFAPDSGYFVAVYDTTSGLLSITDHLSSFSLFQNYPNPFNPVTSIQYVVSSRQFVTLKVYDVLGNEIATLVNEEKQPGIYEDEFNIKNHSGEGRNLTSGIYFYQLKAGSFVETKKMVLMK